jgi:hypothetical protein
MCWQQESVACEGGLLVQYAALYPERSLKIMQLVDRRRAYPFASCLDS